MSASTNTSRRAADGSTLVRALDALLGDNGVLLSPVNAAAGWLADGRMSATMIRACCHRRCSTLRTPTSAGIPRCRCPRVSRTSAVPFGLQVAGPRYRDGMLLGLAHALGGRLPVAARCSGYRTWADEVL